MIISSGKATELKTKAAALASLVVVLVGQGLLAGTVTDFVPSLPDWLEVGAYGLIASGVTWLGGYFRSNVAGKLSESTIKAVQEELARRAAKRV
jgi:hypothetical protein